MTPRNGNAGEITAYLTLGGTESCPAPQVEVQTYKGPRTPEPFYVVVYR